MEVKKLLYFDYWTVGIHNFTTINQELIRSGVQTRLFHTGSWRNPDVPAHEIIEGVECFDIKYYKTNFIHNVLKKEKPDAVLMLNASFITDRTIILSCRKLGIKLIYLMHGALTGEEYIDQSIESSNKHLKKNRTGKIVKYFKNIIPNYFYSGACYNPFFLLSLHPCRVLINSFFNPAKYLHFPPPAFDLIPDKAIVYGEVNKNFYISYAHYPDFIISVVGNPSLDIFFQAIPELPDNRDGFLNNLCIPTGIPFVTYIEEGMVEDNIWDNEQRINFFRDIQNVCSECGLHLVIKLHPRTAKGPNRDTFYELKGVTVLGETDFPKLIYFSEKCISHYSTTLMYPVLLDKPIIIPYWGLSARLSRIYSEKIVTYCTSPDEFKKMLLQKDFAYKREEYIQENVPYRDGNTLGRIVAEIKSTLYPG